MQNRQENTEPAIQAVDLFCGAGGLSLAALNSGCEVVFAVESDRHASASYERNLCMTNSRRNTKLYSQDIREIDPNELARVHFCEGTECDILLGGPPCQGFSTHRIKGAGVNDPRNALIYSYFDFIKALQPRAFLMENVPGLLWPRHTEYLETFYELARDNGYNVFLPCKLDARDFGVPQRRQRVFILGLRDSFDTASLVWPPAQTHHSDGHLLGLEKWQDCSHAFEAPKMDDPNDIHMKHGPELTEVFRRTPLNGGSRKDSGRILPCHKAHDGHKDVYGRIDPQKPAPTMTTACINPSKGRFVHPTKHHGITVRQAARIQTFPDTFEFIGGLTAAGKQIGNAVPIKLGEALISAIAAYLREVVLQQSNNVGELYEMHP